MIDLKPLPCPFCGRKPSLRKGKRYVTTNPVHVAGEWMYKPGVKCTTCKIDRDFESVEEAAEWWNTRKG